MAIPIEYSDARKKYIRDGEPMKPASVGIIYTKKKEVLLLRRNNKPEGWGFPGGKQAEEWETDIDILRRELKEELGASLNESIRLGLLESIDGRKVTVFLIPVDHAMWHIKLSREHRAFMWTTSLEGVELAGNTGKFYKLAQDFIAKHLVDLA